MFVPSLSWHNDRFLHKKWGKMPFSYLVDAADVAATLRDGSERNDVVEVQVKLGVDVVRHALRKTYLFLSFSYVFPEPVLAK
eukprot:COSAG06_NODE_10454_length_1676_cov_1.380380_3_plen_82_part_00